MTSSINQAAYQAKYHRARGVMAAHDAGNIYMLSIDGSPAAWRHQAKRSSEKTIKQ